MTNQKSTIGKIKDLISSGYLNKAIIRFKEIIEDKSKNAPKNEGFKELENSIILLQAKYNNLKKGEINGNLEQSYIDLEKTKISNSLINLVQIVVDNPANSSQTLNTQEMNDYESIEVDSQIRNRTIELTIDENFEDYSDNDKIRLLKAIKELLGMKNDIKINKIKRGSVILSIDIPENKYKILIDFFKEGHLDKYKIIKIDNEEKSYPKVKEQANQKDVKRSRGRNMKIFVAKLSYETTEENLIKAFGKFGRVDSVRIIMDIETGKSMGFGFVFMPNEDEGIKAINELNNSELDGNKIIVKEAKSIDYRRGDRRGRRRSNRRKGGDGYIGGSSSSDGKK